MRLYHGSNMAFRDVDLSVEMLVREMQFKQLTIQYSFHTPLAVSALKFVGVDDVY
ncbi:MAG: hypothetical protein IJL17_05730 [Kiritimatiellae bacterium]|nr:hypothetical protein [Kiritimatiellia bacterium]